MEKKYSCAHIGESYLTNEGYTAVVVAGGSKTGTCTTQINNWVTEAKYGDVKRGKIRYPYHKSVYSTGFLGEGEYSRKSHPEVYEIWAGMLNRCYNPKTQERQPTYKNVAVCKEWHNFQNFAEWGHTHYINGWQLDKDLMSTSSKIYSSSTCVFLPPSLNKFLSSTKTTNTSGCTGIRRYGNSTKWRADIVIDGKATLLGCFTSKQEAEQAYINNRKLQAEKWKFKMKDTLPSNALANII